MQTLPSFDVYCEKTNGLNALVFDISDSLRVWFSYKTPVAFLANGAKVVSENQWGPTTGKHLNAIDNGDKKTRLPRADFEAKLAAALES